jgi:hypothetical protein
MAIGGDSATLSILFFIFFKNDSVAELPPAILVVVWPPRIWPKGIAELPFVGQGGGSTPFSF